MKKDFQVALVNKSVPTPGTPWFENQGWRRTTTITITINKITISTTTTVTITSTTINITITTTD